MWRLPSLAALLFAFALPAAAAPVTAAEPPSPEHLKAQELVKQLGSPVFRVRDAAARRLVEMGRQAKAALESGMSDPDPEVADRCRRLLPVAREADLKARIAAFLADKGGTGKHDLPGWERFRKLAGNDQAARELFAEMLKSNAALLDAVEQEPKLAAEKYAVRVHELQQLLYGPNSGGPRTGPSLGDMLALLLIGTDPETGKSQQANNMMSNFLHQPSLRNALNNNAQAPAVKKLLLAWMDQREDVNSVNQSLALVMNLNLKEGVPFAIKATRAKENPVYVRAQAITTVGKLGGKEHARELESVLDDDTQVSNFQINGKMGTTQLRDVALAMIIHLHGQNPKEYGYDMLQNQQLVFSYYYLGFADDAKRAAAHKKWKEWVAKNKPAPAEKK